MKKVIGYVRVSTDKQDLQRQRVLIEKYCKENGHDLQRFIGEKISGAVTEREGLNELLNLHSDETDLIIVSELSRISRQDDIMNVISDINQIRKNGIDLFILDSKTLLKASDKVDAIEVMRLVFTAAGNAEERKKITERMKTGKYAKLQKNHYAFLGGQIPFGFNVIDNPAYDKNKDDRQPTKILVRNEEEIALLEMFLTKIVNGYTLYRLAVYLRDNKIELRIKTKQHIDAFISNLVNSDLYIGKRDYRGEIYDIEPVVDVELMMNARKALKSNKLFTSYVSEERYNPLKGLLFCTCGRSMTLTNCKGYYYYRCAHKKDLYKNVRCKNNGVSSKFLFDSVWKVSKAYIRKEEYKHQTDEKERMLKKEMEIISSAIEKINEEMTQKDDEKKRLIDTLLNLSNPSLAKVVESNYEKVESEIVELKKELESRNKEYGKLNKQLTDLQKANDNIELDNMTIETKSAYLKRIIEKIVWCSDVIRRGFAEITYKNGRKIVLIMQNDNVCTKVIVPTFDFELDIKRRQIEGRAYERSTINEDGTINFNLDRKIVFYKINEALNNWGDIEANEWEGITYLG